MFIPGVTGKARCLSPTPEEDYNNNHAEEEDDQQDVTSIDSGGNATNHHHNTVGSLERKLQMLKHRQLQEEAKKQHDESQEQFHEQLRRAHEEARRFKSTKKKVFRDALDVSVHPNKLFHLSNHSEEEDMHLQQVHPETPKSTEKQPLDEYWRQHGASRSPKTMRDELDDTIIKAPQQQQQQQQLQLLQTGLGTLDEEDEGLSLDGDDEADGLDGLDGLDALEMVDEPLERPWEADDDYCFKPIVPPGAAGTLEVEGRPEEELDPPADSGSKHSRKSISSRSSSGSKRHESRSPRPNGDGGDGVAPSLSDDLAQPSLEENHQQQTAAAAATTTQTTTTATLTPAQQQAQAKMVQNGLTSRSSRRRTNSGGGNAGQGTSIQKDLDLYLERKAQKHRRKEQHFSSACSLQSEINFYIQQYKEQRGARDVERLYTAIKKEADERVKYQNSYATLDSDGEAAVADGGEDKDGSDDGGGDDDDGDLVAIDTSASSTGSDFHQSSSSLSTEGGGTGTAPLVPVVRRKNLKRQPRQVTLVKPNVPTTMVKSKKRKGKSKSGRRRKAQEAIPIVIQGEVPSFLRRLGDEL